ncbi:MAG: substrate-binding periplasmic protein [Pseudomonadales bacterium]
MKYFGLIFTARLIAPTLALALAFSSAVSRADQSLDILTSKRYIAKICNKILIEALATIDYKMNPVYLPSNRAAAMVNQGYADATACRIGGFENKFTNMLRIEPSITKLYSHLFTTTLKLPISDGSWHLLRPHRLGIFNGHYYAARGTASFPQVTPFDSNLQMLKMLDIGRIEGAVMLTVDAVQTLRENDFENKINISERALSKLPLYLYIHKKNAHLVDQLNVAIRQIVSSGRAKEITDQMHRAAFEGIAVYRE